MEISNFSGTPHPTPEPTPNPEPQPLQPTVFTPQAIPQYQPPALTPIPVLPLAPTHHEPHQHIGTTAVAATYSTNQSQAVVQVLSPRGIEYVFLTIALFTGAAGLTSVLLALVNGQTGFDVLAFPVALLVAALPVFAGLFVRLKKAELADPALKVDASKRRSTQTTQIASFLVSFFSIIGFITALFAKVSGNYDGSFVKVFLDVLVLVLVSGGILVYYWFDEHRA